MPVYTTYVIREIVSSRFLKRAFNLSLVRITVCHSDSFIVYTLSLLKRPVLLGARRRIKPVKLDVEITFIENTSIIRDVHFI